MTCLHFVQPMRCNVNMFFVVNHVNFTLCKNMPSKMANAAHNPAYMSITPPNICWPLSVGSLSLAFDIISRPLTNPLKTYKKGHKVLQSHNGTHNNTHLCVGGSCWGVCVCEGSVYGFIL